VQRSEDGAGTLSTILGAGVFVLLMLFAAQVLIGLYASSVVSAATYDAAKSVAGSDSGDAARGDAVANARAQLGEYGRRVTFDWSGSSADVVKLQARAPRPSFLSVSLTGPVLGDIVRTVTVRVEKVR
jgi:Flp pilus assembly protein TadG